MVEGRKGGRREVKALFEAAVLIGLGEGPDLNTHGLGGIPTGPEALGPFSGKLEGLLGAGHPCGHGEAGLCGGMAMGF